MFNHCSINRPNLVHCRQTRIRHFNFLHFWGFSKLKFFEMYFTYALSMSFHGVSMSLIGTSAIAHSMRNQTCISRFSAYLKTRFLFQRFHHQHLIHQDKRAWQHPCFCSCYFERIVSWTCELNMRFLLFLLAKARN